MYDLIKNLLLSLLRVPPEPTDPFGDEESVRVFRAAPSYLRYKLLHWAIAMTIFTLSSIVGLGVLHVVAVTQKGAWPLHLLALLGWALLAIILFFSYAKVRLEYEMRWYKVSDRSLRIREGVFLVREMTMTFANIQNISITQGPLQRYFGISDLKVQTAGGGGSAGSQEQQRGFVFQMHIGYFRGVDNAEEIRNLIQERLRHYRDSGLGDLDEQHTPASAPEAMVANAPALLAVLTELRSEAARLHAAARAIALPPPPS